MFQVRAAAGIQKRRGTFVVPVRSRLCLKSLQIPPRHLRRADCVVKERLAVRRLSGQRAEQGKVILAAEEDNLLVRSVRQHADIQIPIRIPAALEPVSALAERDVVIRRQKIRSDEAPSRREDVHALDIDAGLKRIADEITKRMRGVQVNASRSRDENCTTKLILRADDAQIKIEVTPVLRGCVCEPAVKHVSPKVEEEFGFAEMPLVSFADLYAGKIMAALDRQHPRDLFDIRDLLAR
jgi:hypothetical protein